jgi:hypothetical protein
MRIPVICHSCFIALLFKVATAQLSGVLPHVLVYKAKAKYRKLVPYSYLLIKNRLCHIRAPVM